jgi:transcription initiation factor TFIID TATA-box-binding protein
MVPKEPNDGAKGEQKPQKINFNTLKPVIKINCIVVKAELHAVIDLYALSKNVKGVDYEPEQFPGAIYKVFNPNATIILFKNGKMICTGTNTIANVRKVLDTVAQVVSKYVLEVTPKSK